MKTRTLAFLTVFSISIFAAPACFAGSAFALFTKPGKPYYSTKSKTTLPFNKNSKSVVCVNRNYDDTQEFGNALCKALDEYSFDCMVKLAEFIKKEEVVGYDYVWTFQVKKWKDKNHDSVPEKLKASILVYDKDFNKILKSSVKIRKSRDLQAPSCLEVLAKEYVESIFTNVPKEKKTAAPKEKKAVEKKAKPAKEKKAKAKKEKPAKKAKQNEKQA